ncbi:MAG: hypothetical protein AAF411_26365 [Myxococcota bacterium]
MATPDPSLDAFLARLPERWAWPKSLLAEREGPTASDPFAVAFAKRTAFWVSRQILISLRAKVNERSIRRLVEIWIAADNPSQHVGVRST